MPDNKKEQIKLFIVIGLAIVAVIFGYFRFIHKKSPQGAGPAAPATALITPFNVPKIEIKMPQTAKKSESPVNKFLRPVIKDIFQPFKWPEKEEPPPPPEPEPEPEPPKIVLDLKLRGTVVGGESALALINDKFLRTGDRIGEYRVVRISKDEVLISSNGDQKLLEIYKNVSSKRIK